MGTLPLDCQLRQAENYCWLGLAWLGLAWLGLAWQKVCAAVLN